MRLPSCGAIRATIVHLRVLDLQHVGRLVVRAVVTRLVAQMRQQVLGFATRCLFREHIRAAVFDLRSWIHHPPILFHFSECIINILNTFAIHVLRLRA